MSDGTKIIPSSPPAEPKDVTVTPSPGPAQPFEVPINLSPPPAGTFDVPIYPDGPPFETIDVTTISDPPPAQPFQVPTTPDGPPATPVNVPTYPDGPPAAPVDVPVLPDAPPTAPMQVPVAPSSPPRDPIDVPVEPTSPPVLPISVSVVPSSPPAEVVEPKLPVQSLNTDGTVDDPIFVVEAVLQPPNPGVPALPYPLSPNPTIAELVTVVEQTDKVLAGFLQSGINYDGGTFLGYDGILHGVTPYAGALDPLVLAGWFHGYIQSVGIGGVARFMAEQGVLFAMNIVGRVFNPGYMGAMSIPGSMGNFVAAPDVVADNFETRALTRDKLLKKTTSASPLRPGGDTDAFGPSHTFMEGADVTIDELVEAALDGSKHPLITRNPLVAEGAARFDAAKYFEKSDTENGGQNVRDLVKKRAISNVAEHSPGLRKSAAIDGIIRVGTRGENADGFIITPTADPSDAVIGGIDDDEARVPLCFTDMRKDTAKNGYRSAYFRPLNVTFAESLAPDWSEGSSFGRVDPLVSYKSTTKSFSVGFELHAFAPEDLELMYKKKTFLESLCYPSYDANSLFRSGPICRLRLGDVIGNSQGGLAGVIKSLSFDFSEALWELRRGMKAPMSFKVALEFLVLHDGPVGTLNGQFGILQLPSGGGSETNFAEGAQVIPGLYARFGEPTRK